jgi:hypothetical protein
MTDRMHPGDFMGEQFTCNFERLVADVPATRVAFDAGEPFPHVVIDDFLTQDALIEAIAAFPPSGAPIWKVDDFNICRKKYCSEELHIPAPLRRVIRDLNSTLFLRYLSNATGIDYLLPDVTFAGSGLFLIDPGGYLNVHADFNVHFLNKLDRRLNLLLYLNLGWRDAYGGHLELWRDGGAACEKAILPIANRCVIFATTDQSFHGHPKPLSCPPDRSRNCISIYYYTNGRPDAERTAPHNTLWRPNPHVPQ